MNIFYAPKHCIYDSYIELRDQEAHHVSKVLRYQRGDDITVVDGAGGRFSGKVAQISSSTVTVSIQEKEVIPAQEPRLVLGMGIIKKRDRLEFAVEKATELGISEIVLYQGRHTVKQNVRMDRLEKTVCSAMKQSLRAYLPQVKVMDCLLDVLNTFEGMSVLAAHEKTAESSQVTEKHKQQDELLLLVGPEGGLSDSEIENIKQQGGELISLGPNRLRTETAVVALVSQFI